MVKLSRRKITTYIADELIKNAPKKHLINQLAAYLIDTKRTKELDLVVRDIGYELKQRGVVLADITSAFDLQAETTKAIEGFIKQQTGASTVYLRQFVDSSVIGGVKVTTPDQEFDSTIARRLTNLRTTYKN